MIEEIKIENMIYEIRGKQVMLDSDIAKLYQVETKRLNEAIKRNKNRFLESFCFQLTNEENLKLSSRSQITTLNKSNNLRGYNTKYLPYVLTEQGIMMLSGLLRSDIAVKVNIKIMGAFVNMRHFINDNIEIFKNLEEIKTLTIQNTNDIRILEESFDKFKTKEKINHIFYDGQIYDAYSLLVDILKQAKKEIAIIDNYLDKTILDILISTKANVIIITNKYNKIDIEKYNEQYSNLTIKIDNTFHDRFILIDKNILYHCGASFKDLGTKCFAINKIEDNDLIIKIINKLK